tara:strand:+ start:699 stop:1214 length:516 start_codon:yes stop_codon:yes gene_type:complete
MADLVGAIEKLKRLLEDRAKRVGRATNTNPSPSISTTSQSVLYIPPSTWMKSLEYFPMAKAPSGSVIMRARGPNIGYIYPRIGKNTFNKWVANNWRGGKIYWYASPSLKDYSIIARTSGSKARKSTGRSSAWAFLKNKRRKNLRAKVMRGPQAGNLPAHVLSRARVIHHTP